MRRRLRQRTAQNASARAKAESSGGSTAATSGVQAGAPGREKPWEAQEAQLVEPATGLKVPASQGLHDKRPAERRRESEIERD